MGVVRNADVQVPPRKPFNKPDACFSESQSTKASSPSGPASVRAHGSGVSPCYRLQLLCKIKISYGA